MWNVGVMDYSEVIIGTCWQTVEKVNQLVLAGSEKSNETAVSVACLRAEF
jgi:hypothetical protein